MVNANKQDFSVQIGRLEVGAVNGVVRVSVA